jgi:uncharacterized protein (TIGR00251 family)
MISKQQFKVLVKSNARKNEILGFDEQKQAYKVAIKEPAEDNRANEELVRFLSKELGKKVRIISGRTSKVKIVRVL